MDALRPPSKFPASRVRVKICGITRPADALLAALLGADAIGLVFYPPSPRAVDLETGLAIRQVLPPFVTLVGLFVNADPVWIRTVLGALSLDLLQFHGDETPEECSAYQRPYIKALQMRQGVEVAAWARRYGSASGLLLDAYHQEKRGGTGATFDWSLIPASLGKPLILAGGLSPGNIAAALHRVRPFAVDVSGGVEAAKGVKDLSKMAAFIHEVNRFGNADR
jgi:phosphoribosylanthranilate isomerase